MMVTNLSDRAEIECFLRDANAEQLNSERRHLNDLAASGALAASGQLARNLLDCIAYELRFRVPLEF